MKESKLILSKPWQKFFLKLPEFKNIPTDNWEPIHLLGYFCDKYEWFFQRPYSFSFQGPPSRCTEIVFIKKIFAAIDSTKSKKVKEYIDWIFEEKIKPKNYQMRSISFLLSKGFGNEFMAQEKKSNTITKSTNLPENFIELVKKAELSFPIKTYNDLLFLKEFVSQDEDNSYPSAKVLLKELEDNGLNLSNLDKKEIYQDIDFAQEHD